MNKHLVFAILHQTLQMPGAGTQGKHQLTLNRTTELALAPAYHSSAICCQGILCW